jgi:hypothetical protein
MARRLRLPRVDRRGFGRLALPTSLSRPHPTSMFDIVRQDLQRCVRVNQTGSRNLSAYLRELFNPGIQAILTHRLRLWISR